MKPWNCRFLPQGWLCAATLVVALLLPMGASHADVDMRSGAASVSIPLGKISAGNGLDRDFVLRYSSNVRKTLRADNYKAPTGWLGMGWACGFPYVMADLGPTSFAIDNEYYISLDGMSMSQILRNDDGKYFIESEPYARINPTTDANGHVITWQVVLKDGTRVTFGEGDHNAARKTPYYGSYVGPKDMGTETGHLYYRWDVSVVMDVTAQRKIEFFYRQLPNDGDPNTLADDLYTRESYPDSIRALVGGVTTGKIRFHLEDKTWHASSPTVREYINPGFGLDRYQTKFLDSAEIFGPKGGVVRAYKFQYGFVYAENHQNSADSAKRVLENVKIYNATGALKPGYDISYSASDDHALYQILNPEGLTKTFNYASHELFHSEKASPVIPSSGDDDDRKAFSNGEFVFVLDASYIRVYRQTGTAFRKVYEYDQTTGGYGDICVGSDYFLLYGQPDALLLQWNGVQWLPETPLDQQGDPAPLGAIEAAACATNYFVANTTIYTRTEDGWKDVGARPGGNGDYMMAMEKYLAIQHSENHWAYTLEYNGPGNPFTSGFGEDTGGWLCTFPVGCQTQECERCVPDLVEIHAAEDYYVVHRYNYEPPIVQLDCSTNPQENECDPENPSYTYGYGVNFDFRDDFQTHGWGATSPSINMLPPADFREVGYWGNLRRWVFPRPDGFGDIGDFFHKVVPYRFPYTPLEIPNCDDLDEQGNTHCLAEDVCPHEGEGVGCDDPVANNPYDDNTMIATTIFTAPDYFIVTYGKYWSAYAKGGTVLQDWVAASYGEDVGSGPIMAEVNPSYFVLDGDIWGVTIENGVATSIASIGHAQKAFLGPDFMVDQDSRILKLVNLSSATNAPMIISGATVSKDPDVEFTRNLSQTAVAHGGGKVQLFMGDGDNFSGKTTRTVVASVIYDYGLGGQPDKTHTYDYGVAGEEEFDCFTDTPKFEWVDHTVGSLGMGAEHHHFVTLTDLADPAQTVDLQALRDSLHMEGLMDTVEKYRCTASHCPAPGDFPVNSSIREYEFHQRADWPARMKTVRTSRLMEKREGIVTEDATFEYDFENGQPKTITRSVGGRVSSTSILFAYQKYPGMDSDVGHTHQLTQIQQTQVSEFRDSQWSMRSMEQTEWSNADGNDGFMGWENKSGAWFPYRRGTFDDRDNNGAYQPDDGDELLVTYISHDSHGNISQTVSGAALQYENGDWAMMSAPPVVQSASKYAIAHTLAIAERTMPVNPDETMPPMDDFCVGLFSLGSVEDEGWACSNPSPVVANEELLLLTGDELSNSLTVQKDIPYLIDFEALVHGDIVPSNPDYTSQMRVSLGSDDPLQVFNYQEFTITKRKQKFHAVIHASGDFGQVFVLPAYVKFEVIGATGDAIRIDNIIVRSALSQLQATAYDPVYRKPVESIDNNYQHAFTRLDSWGDPVATLDSSGGATSIYDATLSRDASGEPNENEVATFPKANYAPNWSFEKWMNRDKWPDNWEPYGDASIAVTTFSTAPYGRHAMIAVPAEGGAGGCFVISNGEYHTDEYDGTNCIKSYSPNDPHYHALVGQSVTISAWVYHSSAASRTFTIGCDGNTETASLAVAPGQWEQLNLHIPALNPQEGSNSPCFDYAKQFRFFVVGTYDAGNPEFYVDGAYLHLGEETPHPLVATTYTDAGGNELQRAKRGNGKSIVNATVYDEYGRVSRVIKPVVVTDEFDRLKFISDPLSLALQLYDGQEAHVAQGYPQSDGKPYSELEYIFGDPLSRIQKQGMPGGSFCLGSGHEAMNQYITTGDLTSAEDLNSPEYYVTWELDENRDLGTAHGKWVNALGQTVQRQVGKFGSATERTENKVRTPADSALTSLTYDFFDRVLSVTNPEGTFTQYNYDYLGRMVSEHNSNIDSPHLYIYDASGNRRFSKSAKQQAESQPGDCEFTAHYYDGFGRITGTAIITDKTVDNSYFAQGYAMIPTWPDEAFVSQHSDIERVWKVRHYYDDLSNIPVNVKPRVFDAFSNSGNCRGRIVAKIAFLDGDDDAESNTIVHTYHYDGYGRMDISAKKIPGLAVKWITTSFDDVGRLTKREFSDDGGIAQYYAYDHLDRLNSVSRGNTPATAKAMTQYSFYDASGLVSRTELGQTRAGSADKALQGIDYAYDIRNRPIQANHQDLDGTSDFLAKSVAEAHGATAAQYGDLYGQLMGYEKYGQIASLVGETSFANDYAQYNGNMSWSIWNTAGHTSDPQGRIVRGYLHKFDHFGRLGSSQDGIQDEASGTWDNSVDSRSAAYAYDKEGRILRRRMNSIEVPSQDNYVYYSGTHRLQYVHPDHPITDQMPTQSVGSNYIYDANGNMVADVSKGLIVRYDWRDLPTNYEFYDEVTGTTWSDLTGTGPRVAVQMTYDADGNRTFKAHSGSYSNENRLVFEKNGDEVILIGEYGNMNLSGALASYSDLAPNTGDFAFETSTGPRMWTRFEDPVYNAHLEGDQTTSQDFGGDGLVIDNPEGNTVMMITADGDLVTKGSVSSKVTYLAGLNGEIVATYDDFGNRDYTNLFADELVGRSVKTGSGTDNREYYYVSDYLGNTRVVITEDETSPGSGQYELEAVEAYDYYPYGHQIRLKDVGVNTRPTFTGKEFDQEGASEAVLFGIGQYYFGVRYYDPLIALWSSVDPAGQFAMPFAYAPVPTRYVDETGAYFTGVDPVQEAIFDVNALDSERAQKNAMAIDHHHYLWDVFYTNWAADRGPLADPEEIGYGVAYYSQLMADYQGETQNSETQVAYHLQTTRNLALLTGYKHVVISPQTGKDIAREITFLVRLNEDGTPDYADGVSWVISHKPGKKLKITGIGKEPGGLMFASASDKEQSASSSTPWTGSLISSGNWPTSSEVGLAPSSFYLKTSKVVNAISLAVLGGVVAVEAGAVGFSKALGRAALRYGPGVLRRMDQTGKLLGRALGSASPVPITKAGQKFSTVAAQAIGGYTASSLVPQLEGQMAPVNLPQPYGWEIYSQW